MLATPRGAATLDLIGIKATQVPAVAGTSCLAQIIERHFKEHTACLIALIQMDSFPIYLKNLSPSMYSQARCCSLVTAEQ
jgi:hypothetical protein